MLVAHLFTLPHTTHRCHYFSSKNVNKRSVTCQCKRTKFMYTPVASMEEKQKQEPEAGGDSNIKVKVPKRVLHFSDGVLEEYSDDEVDTDNAPPKQEMPVVDPKTLTWGPWFAYKAWSAGSTALAACDYVGESLASFLGITTPKYYFELEEYKRREAAKKALDEEKKGWCEPTEVGRQIHMVQVKSKQPVKEEIDGA